MPDDDQDPRKPQPFPFRVFLAPQGSVLQLLRRFAREKSACFDDVVARFFSSALCGEFDHSDLSDRPGEAVCDLTISFSFSLRGTWGRHTEPYAYRTQPVDRHDLLEWLSDWGLLSKPAATYKKLIFEVDQPDSSGVYNICADILSQCAETSRLYSFLAALRIDHHDFARWVTECLQDNAQMLTALGADPRQSWTWKFRKRRRIHTRRIDAISRNVSPRILNVIDETDLSGPRARFIDSLARALVPVAKSSTYWRPRAIPLSEYIHEAYREDVKPDQLRKWLSTAFQEADRLKNC
ncbi:MAG: hypothetical protein RIC85_00785 [Gammaproteobacteria bacterium]